MQASMTRANAKFYWRKKMNFKNMDESQITIADDKIVIYAPPKTDFFCGSGIVATTGVLPENLLNAPFYYTEFCGDFVMRAKVSHEFKYTYDACTLMVMQSDAVWAKLCFEKTDFNTHAVVSVVTNGISDDANGCNIDADSVWLQIARSGNAFSFHYSLDGEKYDMVRFFALPVDQAIKIGLVAQSPTGNGGDRVYENFSIENLTVNNLREGK